jgi:XapX domain-containing protein
MSLVLGLVVGGVFGIFGMQVPAPNNLKGVLGILGIFLGWLLLSTLKKRLGW